MRALVGLLVVLGVLVVGAFVAVSVRDRRRMSSAEDSAAARVARCDQERYAAERHGMQGEVWRRGQNSP
ncbi:hypothetical protein ACIODS_28160 [Micromonospora chalcea]|uniref:hypothetical protein n=1 Tax=Micromonospora chalcea TaxID=1874 RepID=UPI00382734FB